MEFDSFSIADLHHHISSPTCEDLGIPRDLGRDLAGGGCRAGAETPSPVARMLRGVAPEGGTLDGPVLSVDGLKYEVENPNNPFSPFCQIPVPNPYAAYECGFEPAFIRKRNERERERVRGVNDGYQRLRNHLPLLENKEKRISKVETLRSAIKYIRHLQTLLAEIDRATGSAAKLATSSSDSENMRPDRDPVKGGDKGLKVKHHSKVLSEPKAKRKALDRDD